MIEELTQFLLEARERYDKIMDKSYDFSSVVPIPGTDKMESWGNYAEFATVGNLKNVHKNTTTVRYNMWEYDFAMDLITIIVADLIKAGLPVPDKLREGITVNV